MTHFSLTLLFSSLIMLSLVACASRATSTSPTPDSAVAGREVYLRVCASCHGQNAKGYANALQAPALDATEHAYEHPDQQIHDWIVNGKLGRKFDMPALGDQLSDDDVHAVIDYLHTLWTQEQLAIQQNITSRWPATPEPRRKN